MAKTVARERKQLKKAAQAPRERVVEEHEPTLTEGPTCVHHWVIASPDGEMSVGRCKVCGVEKEFPNSAEDYLWERSVPQSRWTGRAESTGGNAGY